MHYTLLEYRNILEKQKLTAALEVTKLTVFQENYQNRLQEYLRNAKKLFDSPIGMIERREDIENNFDFHRYPKYDLRAKRIVGYLTKEEALKAYDYQKEKQERLFAQRGEFDEKKAEDRFRMSFEEKKKQALSMPLFLIEKCGVNLLALDYVTEEAYMELELERKGWTEIIQAKEKEIEKSNQLLLSLPKRIQYVLTKRNLALVSYTLKENDLLLTFKKTSILEKGSSDYCQFLFHGFSVLNKEALPNEGTFSSDENVHLIDAILEPNSGPYKAEFLISDRNRNLKEIEFCFQDVELKLNLIR